MFRVQTLVCSPAALRWREHAKARTLNFNRTANSNKARNHNHLSRLSRVAETRVVPINFYEWRNLPRNKLWFEIANREFQVRSRADTRLNYWSECRSFHENRFRHQFLKYRQFHVQKDKRPNPYQFLPDNCIGDFHNAKLRQS